tara:strand:- start:1724 stop:4840 length:3117 start_codon:yes stop_codon:yes gene_type:complete
MKQISKTDSFFVLRTPRLPFNLLEALLSPDNDIDALLANWLSCEQVMESLYIASPSLHSRVAIWLREPHSKQGKKIRSTLIKYFIRMSSRPTPFGLFSGVSMGKLSEHTNLTLLADSKYKRNTRFDILMLSQLKAAISKRELKNLSYRTNPSIVFFTETLHYIEPYDSQDAKHYRLSSVEKTDILEFVLSLCELPVSFRNITLKLHAQYENFSIEELAVFVKQLIDESVIIPHLPLPLTGPSPDKAMLASLRPFAESDVLKRGVELLKHIDNKKRPRIEDYKSIITALRDLPIDIQENKLFQVDISPEIVKSELAVGVTSKIQQAIELISRASAVTHNPFSSFIAQFNKRFDQQLIPLTAVLDDESGIGFSEDTGYESNLLSNLNLRKRLESYKNNELSPLQKLILRKMSLPNYQNTETLMLSSNELTKAIDSTQDNTNLPYSYAAVVSLFQHNDKELIKLISVYGPSAANLIGRFCHLNESLREHVKAHLKQEELHSEDVVFAEVIHMPDGRPGNVIARPRLRDYEIVFMADSDIENEYSISVNDLYVWVEENRIKLWSKRLKKQVIPRMSNAHNFSNRSLSVYRFLCSIQYQYYSIPTNIMPDVFSIYCFTPRVMLDDMVLHEKTWLIPHSALSSVLEKNKYCHNRYKALKEKYQLDDVVVFSVGDNALTLNLKNPLLFTMLVEESKMFEEVVLKESLTNQYVSSVKNDAGECYANEIIVPLVNKYAAPYKTVRLEQLDATFKYKTRNYSPGSKWMSIKVYSGNNQVERLLAYHLATFLKSSASLFDKWFFIRLGDPDWHLRIRFLGEPEVLYGKLLPLIHQHLQPFIDNNEVERVELFTYQRELERYGGEQLLEHCETLFMLESDLATELIPLVHIYGDDLRWRAAALCIDRILTSFGYSLPQKLGLVNALRNSFGQEFNENVELRKQLGKRYRNLKSVLINDFNFVHLYQELKGGEATQEFFTKIKSWGGKYEKVVADANLALKSSSIKKDELIASLLHMLNNRLFFAYTREHEFVMYDLLRRFYLSITQTQQK